MERAQGIIRGEKDKPILNYVFAAGVMILALLIRAGLDPWLVERAPSLTLSLAVAAAAIYGGLWPGLFVTTVGGVLANIYFVAPRGQFDISLGTPLLQFLLFIGVGGAISLVAEYGLRRKAEADIAQADARRESERKEAILESITDGFIALNADWQLTYVNSAAEDILRQPRERLLGTSIWQALPQLAGTEIEHALRQGAEAKQPIELESKKIADGSWLHVTVYPCERHMMGQRGITVLLHDISERKRVEQSMGDYRAQLELTITEQVRDLQHAHQALRTSERMAALGTLSAGISHDIGNLLLPVRVRLEQLRQQVPDPEAADAIDAITKAVHALVDLSNNLRLFAIDPAEAQHPGVSLDLSEWLHTVERLIHSALPASIDFTFDLPDGLPPVAICAPGLTQAVFNVLVNAADAIGDSEGYISLRAHRDGENVFLTIEDDGPGIDKEQLAHVFEPFFTTKTRQISSGLGLAVVHGIITSAGGSLSIDSPAPKQSKGTVVTFTLPVAYRSALRTTTNAVMSVANKRVAAMVSALLKMSEANVITADSPYGTSAVDVWVTDAEPDRIEEARRLKQVNPKAAIIAVGGEGIDRWKQVGALSTPANPKPSILRRVLAKARLDIGRELGEEDLSVDQSQGDAE